jgi:hypothetical protein
VGCRPPLLAIRLQRLPQTRRRDRRGSGVREIAVGRERLLFYASCAKCRAREGRSARAGKSCYAGVGCGLTSLGLIQQKLSAPAALRDGKVTGWKRPSASS